MWPLSAVLLHPEAKCLLVPSIVDLWLLWAASAVIELKMAAAESTPPPIEEAYVRVVVDGGLVLTAIWRLPAMVV